MGCDSQVGTNVSEKYNASFFRANLKVDDLCFSGALVPNYKLTPEGRHLVVAR
jgi:hypothetical protein